MKIDKDTREALGLKKEYDRHVKYGTRADAPKIEQEYYMRMAENISRKINWRLLEKKTKKEERQDEVYS